MLLRQWLSVLVGTNPYPNRQEGIFVSTEQTGTGGAQNIAHGLGVVPTCVLVAPTDLNVATIGQYTVTEGAHDATNVVVTVTLNKKYKVMAVA